MTTRTIAILAGGQSSRMGRDKADLLLGGRTFLERIAEAATPVGDTVVVGRTAAETRGDVFDDVEFVEDDRPGLGPLGGLDTALKRADGPVALVACDNPLLDPKVFRWLFEVFESSEAEHGVVSRCGGTIQPVFAVYRPECRPIIVELIDAQRRALRALVDRGDFEEVVVPDELAGRLRNVNTPEEFRRLVEEFGGG